jgi:opacity protein-like surface antigen
MSKFLKLTVATITAVFFYGSAIAFQGISIGVIGDSADFSTTGKEYQLTGGVPNGEDAKTGSHSADAEFPAIFIEYTGGEAGGMSYSLGIEYTPGEAEIGAKSRTDTNSTAGNDGGDDGTYTAKAEIEDLTTLYIEPGYQINDNFALYGKTGISHTTVKTLESLANGTDSSTYPDADVFGFLYGIGVKANLNSGIFAKLEATTTNFETVKLGSNTGNKMQIEANPEKESVRLAIGYNF